MDRISVQLTVYFENPFWVGIFERVIDNKLSVCKVTFGAEPKDYEVLDFVLHNYSALKYSPEITKENVVKEKVNPKRVQRELKKQIQDIGIGTKSQQALKLQQEENKIIRRKKTREQRELEKEKQYFLKQQKKREKHRGR